MMAATIISISLIACAGQESEKAQETTTTNEETIYSEDFTSDMHEDDKPAVSWKTADELNLVSHPMKELESFVLEGKEYVHEGCFVEDLFPEKWLSYTKDEKKSFLEAEQFLIHQGSALISGETQIELFLSNTSEGEPAVLRLADWNVDSNDYLLAEVIFNGEYYYLVELDEEGGKADSVTPPFAKCYHFTGNLPNAKMSEEYLVLSDYEDLDYLSFAYGVGPLYDEEMMKHCVCVIHLQR